MITVFPNTFLFISLFMTKEMPQFARYADVNAYGFPDNVRFVRMWPEH